MSGNFSGYHNICCLDPAKPFLGWKVLFLTQFFLFILIGVGIGQGHSGIPIMGIPQNYLFPDVSSRDDDILGILTATYWEVYSDRSDNPLYSGPEAINAKGKAGFLEPFFVTNVKGEFLQVYTDPTPDKEGFLSKSAVERGWIKKSKALLWRVGLTDRKNSAYRHLQLLTLSENDLFQSASGTGSSRNGIQVFRSPDLRDIMTMRTNPNEIYYVFKKEGEAWLIGKDRRIPEDTVANGLILGWVPEDQCYILNSRTWLTPAPPVTGSSGKDSLMGPRLFLTYEKAMTYQSTGRFEHRFVTWEDHPDEHDSSWTCFPLVNDKEGVFQVKIIGDDFQNAYGTDLYPSGKTRQFFRVTLVSNFELQSVLSNYQQISSLGDALNDREAIRQTLVRLFKKSNPEETEFSIGNMRLKFVLEQLLWFINSGTLPEDMMLRDIDSPAFLSDAGLEKLVNSIRESEKAIRKIVNLGVYENKVSSFVSNNNRYFWIHTDVFP